MTAAAQVFINKWELAALNEKATAPPDDVGHAEDG